MPRPKSQNPNVRINAVISPEMDFRLRAYLYSEVEGRVPQGAMQTFFTTLVESFFARLDTASAIAERQAGALADARSLANEDPEMARAIIHAELERIAAEAGHSGFLAAAKEIRQC